MGKKGFVSKTIGVLSTYTMQNWSYAVAPILATMYSYYNTEIPYSTISLLASMQSLGMVPAAILSGAIVGQKIKYKPLVLLGMALIVVGGIAPAWFLGNFPLILVFRFINGFGMGFSFSLGPAMIDMMYEGKTRSMVAGFGQLIMGLTGMLYSGVAGALGGNVQVYWYMHLIGLVPFVIALFMLREPPSEEVAARLAAKKALKEKAKAGKSLTSRKYIPRMIWVALAEFFIFMFYYMVVLQVSNLVEREGIGGAGAAATIMMVYSAGGIIGGFAFGPLYNVFKRYMLPIALGLWIAGTAMVCFSKSFIGICVAMLLGALAVNWELPCVPVDFAKYIPAERIAFASGLFNSGMNFGCFLTAIVMGLITKTFGSDDPRLILKCVLVVVTVFSVIWIIVELRKSAEQLGKEVAEDEAELREAARAIHQKVD